MTAARRASFDHTSHDAAAEAVAGHDVVVNCAAWTDVDSAEHHQDEAMRANRLIPEVLARAVRATRGRLIQLSTDYVFAGDCTTAYTENAAMKPQSSYGRSKAAGEEVVRATLPQNHLVVRTAWLYGAHGPCFPRTIHRLARDHDHVPVVDDQVGQPTWTLDVADLIVRLVESSAPAGTYHATSTGSCSWFEFAREVLRAAGMDPEKISPVPSTALARPAPRPANSTLGHDALLQQGLAPIGNWLTRWNEAAPMVLPSLPSESR